MSISLCMIARNESQQISRCLSSVRPYVDDIVVVDTGSTDDTVDKARQWGARVCQVDWEGDFSKARNRSLDEARGEWILFMDCDEELQEQDGVLLLETVKRGDYPAFFVVIANHTEAAGQLEIPSIRLFRNLPGVRFEGRIHEQIIPALVKHFGKNCIGYSGIRIIHHGYNAQVVNIAAKAQRNLNILLGYPQEEKNAFYYYNLGSEFLRLGQASQALPCFDKALQETPTSQGYAPMLIKKMITALMIVNRFEEAIGRLKYYQAVYPDFNDLLLLEAVCQFKRARFSQAALILERYLDRPPDSFWYPSEKESFGISMQQLLQLVESERLDKEGVRISACVFGQDDGEALAEAIKSVNEMADEVIYFDNHSADLSADIAREYGARVVEINWLENGDEFFKTVFNHIRGDWALLLKGDEVLPKSSRVKIVNAARSQQPAYRLPIQTWVAMPSGDSEYMLEGQCRLIRNPLPHRDDWRHLVMKAVVLDAVIDHRHYQLSTQYVNNKTSVRLRRMENKANKSPRDWLVQGRLYFYDQKYQQAVESLERSLTNDSGSRDVSSYYYYARALLKLSDYQSLIKVIVPVLEENPDYVDLRYFLALAYYYSGQAEESGRHLQQCLGIPDPPWAKYTCSRGTGTYKTRIALASICQDRGESSQAVEYLCQAALFTEAFHLVTDKLLALKDDSGFSLEEWMQEVGLWELRHILCLAEAYARSGRYADCFDCLDAAAETVRDRSGKKQLVIWSKKLLALISYQLVKS